MLWTMEKNNSKMLKDMLMVEGGVALDILHIIAANKVKMEP